MKEMGLNTVYRKTEIYDNKTSSWKEVPFQRLKKGQKFRLFEPDGKPVTDDGGSKQWICEKNAEIDPDTGVYYVTIEKNK